MAEGAPPTPIFELVLRGSAVRHLKGRCAAEARKWVRYELKAVPYSCVEDDGRPIGIGFQERVSNQPELLRSKDVVVGVG